MQYGWLTNHQNARFINHICHYRISFEDIFTAAVLESYPTSDLKAPSIGWHYDISYHIITFKYDMLIDITDQNIQIYLLVPPSEQNLVKINRWVRGSVKSRVDSDDTLEL